MQHLGATRSSYRHDHLLQTPDTFVRAALPGMRNAVAIVHAGPAMGAGFTQYTVECGSGGSFEIGSAHTFVFVLEGSIGISGRFKLDAYEYAYFAPQNSLAIHSDLGARAVLIEKPYLRQDSEAPQAFQGNEKAVAPKPLLGDAALEVRTLLPDGPQFDFAVNTMTFQPGASLPMTEIHVMEHGLLMLEGEGIYKLGGHWYPVSAGDFIYMAPYCPQWFGALGKKPAKYLIYKDWNTHPLSPR